MTVIRGVGQLPHNKNITHIRRVIWRIIGQAVILLEFNIYPNDHLHRVAKKKILLILDQVNRETGNEDT